jgi:hypothetical protein
VTTAADANDGGGLWRFRVEIGLCLREPASNGDERYLLSFVGSISGYDTTSLA